MKNYSTNYLGWTFLLLVNLFVVGILVYSVHFGLTYKKEYSMDTFGYVLTLVGAIVLGLFLWETIVLVDFIVKDIKGKLLVDSERLKIIKGKREEIFELKDLQRIEFSGPRTGSNSVTTHLTYCKLTFKDKVIFLTSFTIPNPELVKCLGQRVSRATNRERRFFELIK